jgi:nitrogen fixation NifU-like protein
MAGENLASLGWDELGDLYQKLVLDHYRNPRNQSPIAHPDITAEEQNPFCGDDVAIQASLAEGVIEQVSIQGRGCSISQASLSMMSELLKGKTPEEAQALSAAFKGMMRGKEPAESAPEELGDLAALAGVRKFPIRIKCALLGWVALDDGLASYLARQGGARR